MSKRKDLEEVRTMPPLSKRHAACWELGRIHGLREAAKIIALWRGETRLTVGIRAYARKLRRRLGK